MVASSTRVFVLPIKGREAEVEQLRKLITKAGCIVVCADAKPADFEKCLADADVLVVLICPETQNNPATDTLISQASHDGKRVVGVWIPTPKQSELPAAINKHADATITFDVDAIRDSICGGKPKWTTPEGDPRPTPPTPRHPGKR